MAIYWVTKYALTTGIFSVDAERSAGEDMISWKRPGAYREYAHGLGKGFHDSEKSAIDRANVLREQRIKSLKRQIAKLDKMKF